MPIVAVMIALAGGVCIGHAPHARSPRANKVVFLCGVLLLFLALGLLAVSV